MIGRNKIMTKNWKRKLTQAKLKHSKIGPNLLLQKIWKSRDKIVRIREISNPPHGTDKNSCSLWFTRSPLPFWRHLTWKWFPDINGWTVVWRNRALNGFLNNYWKGESVVVGGLSTANTVLAYTYISKDYNHRPTQVIESDQEGDAFQGLHPQK